MNGVEALFQGNKPSGGGESPVGNLSSSVFCTGFVSDTCLQNARLQVKLDSGTTVDAFYVPHFFGSLFGMKMHYTPPAGSRVVLLKADTPPYFVIGMLPPVGGPGIADPENVAYGPNFTGRPGNSRMRRNRFLGHVLPPIDLLEGELCLENENGVMLAFLSNLMKMQAGDLAKVECLALNDMVRIVSENYAHHNALGDLTIRNEQGKLNLEWHGASEEHEADGRVNPEDAMMGLEEGRERPEKNPEAELEEELIEGRWRMSLYVGWLGDFLNLFISDPCKSLHKLMGVSELSAENYRSGKFRFTVGDDGAVLMQSVSDIVLERVVRIPVPIRGRSAEDPEGTSQIGDRGEGAGTVPKENLGAFGRTTYPDPPLDTEWNPSDADSIHEMVYQLRHYARWLNTSWTTRRFRSLSETFALPSESDTPNPEIEGYTERYSTIRIFRDGSQLLLDAYGNAIHLTHAGITLSSTGNLRLESAGNLFIVAGGRLNMVARKTISITSFEDIKLRASDTLLHIKKASEVVVIAAKNFFSGLVNIAKSTFIAEDLHVTGDTLVKEDVEVGGNTRIGGTLDAGNTTVSKITASTHDIAGPTIKVDQNDPNKANVDVLKPGSGGSPSSPDAADPIEELEPVEDVDDDDSRTWYQSLSQQYLTRKELGTPWSIQDKWSDKITQQKTFESETKDLDEPPDNDNLDRIREQPAAMQDQTLNIRYQ